MGARWLVALVAAATAAHGARGVVRDALLDVPLEELLAHPVDSLDGFDAGLHQALAHCRAEGIVGVVEDLGPVLDGGADLSHHQLQDDIAYCHRIRYTRHVRQRRRARESAVERFEQGGQAEDGGNGRPPVVPVHTTEDFEYQSFFEGYAVKRLPIVLQSSSAEIAQNDAAQQSVLAACFGSHNDAAVLQIENRGCAAQLNNFQVPAAVVNNYVVRTSSSLSPTFLPTLFAVSSSSPSLRSQATCPLGMHTVVLPTEGDVEYALLDILQIPFDQHATDMSRYQEILVSADASASTVFGNPALFYRGQPSFRGVLSSEQSLFIPGGSHAVFLTGTARVLRFCFVDASNFNNVLEILRIEALVSPTARALYLSFRSPGFDTAMVRQPSPNDTVWPSYMQWPKETKLLKRRSMISPESGSSTDTPMLMTRRERLKLWQDEKRWERHVQSLTLPLPLPPVVVNVTRNSATLRWQDLYERPKNDITSYGYEVRWKREDPNSDENFNQEAATPQSGAVNFTHRQIVRSVMPTSLFGDEFDGRDIEGVVYGLSADTTYTFTIRIYVGDNAGVESERSLSARTAPCSPPGETAGVVLADVSSTGCLDLRWLATHDDGGQPITSYLFAVRYLEGSIAELSGGDRSDSLVGGEVLVAMKPPTAIPARAAAWLSASVCEQRPGRIQLRVAAMNSVGVSSWNRQSNSVDIPFQRTASIGTVRARGNPSNGVSLKSIVVDSSRSSTSTPFPRVLLSDVDQRVVVAPGSPAEVHLEVWSGHHSPRGFHVSSELVIANPANAEQQLHNGADVAGRVVVIARDQVPFLFKVQHAQRAGAVGVIFVDTDGRCRHSFDQHCVPGSSKLRGEGFGFSDRHPLWRGIRIPFVLATLDASVTLMELFR